MLTAEHSDLTQAIKYQSRPDYPIEWREVKVDEINSELRPFYVDRETGKETEATWAPQDGSQVAFLLASCIFEVLYEGTRGPGKTDCLLMDFLQHVGKGYGAEWRGILFRQTYPQLSDVINKTQKWFRLLFPDAKYNKATHTWTFPDGEQLLFWSREGKRDQIAGVKPGRSKLRRAYTPPGSRARDPAWLPDGSGFLYISNAM